MLFCHYPEQYYMHKYTDLPPLGWEKQPPTLPSHEISTCPETVSKKQAGNFSPSYQYRKEKKTTLHLHRKGSKSHAVLTSFNLRISHSWKIIAPQREGSLLAKWFHREVKVLAQISLLFLFLLAVFFLLTEIILHQMSWESIKCYLLHSSTYLEVGIELLNCIWSWASMSSHKTGTK